VKANANRYAMHFSSDSLHHFIVYLFHTSLTYDVVVGLNASWWSFGE